MGAKINHSGVIKRILEACKINQLVDKVPHELAEKIVPVLISNPKPNKRNFLITESNTRYNYNNGLYVPAGKRWKILNASMKLTADATVTDRRADISYFEQSGGIELYFFKTATVQTASTVWYYNWMRNITSESIVTIGTAKHFNMPIPDMWLYPAFNVWLNFANVQAGDNWELTMLIEEEDLPDGEFEQIIQS